jgi:hypothetical protein
VLAITLLASEHHMHGPKLCTHVRRYRAEGLDFSLAGQRVLEAVLVTTLLAAEHHMHGPTLSRLVWMYRAEGLDLSLGGHWNLKAVLAITLLAAEHHMHGPTLSTHRALREKWISWLSHSGFDL